MCHGVGTALLNRVTSIRHTEKVRFPHRLEGNRVNQARWLKEEHFTGRKRVSSKALSWEYMIWDMPEE